MISRLASRQTVSAAIRMARPKVQTTTVRNMGGGGKYLHISPIHQQFGELFGVICWVWVFHRARNDWDVVLGYRHPWEHAHDPFDVAPAHVHHDDQVDMEKDWDGFILKATKPGEDDDDDDEDEEEDDDEDEEDDDDE